jgi:hypothetical protein
MGQFFPAPARQRHRQRQSLRRAVPQLDAAPLLQRRPLQGSGLDPDKPPRPGTTVAGGREEADEARRRARHPLGHHGALELRLRRLDPPGSDHVERGPLVNPEFGGEVYYDTPSMLAR